MQLNSIPGFSFIQKSLAGSNVAQPDATGASPSMNADSMQQSPAVRVARLKQDLARLADSVTPSMTAAERLKVEASSAQIQALIDNGGKPLTGRSAHLLADMANLGNSITQGMSAGQLAAVNNNIALTQIQLDNGGKPLLAGAAYSAGQLNDLSQQMGSGKLTAGQMIGAEAQSVVRLAQIRTNDDLTPSQVDAARKLLALAEQSNNPGQSAAGLQKIQLQMEPLINQLQSGKPAAAGATPAPAAVKPTPAPVPVTGITAEDAHGDKNGAVHQEQAQLNDWLKTDSGKTFLATDAGKAIGHGGQLKIDGFEGPLTRAAKAAYGESRKPELQRNIEELKEAKTSDKTFGELTRLDAKIFANQAELNNGGLPLTGKAAQSLADVAALANSITAGTGHSEKNRVATQIFAAKAIVNNGGAPLTGPQAKLMDEIQALGNSTTSQMNSRELSIVQLRQEALKVQFKAGPGGLTPGATKALNSVSQMADQLARTPNISAIQQNQLVIRASVMLATARAGGELTGDAKAAAQEIGTLTHQMGAWGMTANRVQLVELNIQERLRRLPQAD
jgi:hypothetical protein